MNTITPTRRPLTVTIPYAVLLLLAVALPLHADQFGDFTYTDHGTYIEITDYPTSATGPVVIPATIVGKPVTSIGDEAFRDCSGLTSVTFESPSSVTSIGNNAFGSCDFLSSITVDAGNPNYSSLDGVLFDKSQTLLIQCPGGTSGSYAIPSSVTSIGESAFRGCSSLTSVTIPSSVTSIGNFAFYGCSGLTSVTIPSSVTSIGDRAFKECTSLVSACFEGDAPAVENDVFDSAAPGFTVYYVTGSTGFTSPTWEPYGGDVYPSVEIDQSAHPAAFWLLTHGLPYDTDLHQDLNGDGITLLTAYALNLDPSNPLAGMPVPVLDPTTMSMTFYGAAQGITYGAETSTDCQNWVTDGVTISELDPANLRTVTVNRDEARRFLRLTFGLAP